MQACDCWKLKTAKKNFVYPKIATIISKVVKASLVYLGLFPCLRVLDKQFSNQMLLSLQSYQPLIIIYL